MSVRNHRNLVSAGRSPHHATIPNIVSVYQLLAQGPPLNLISDNPAKMALR